MSLLITLAAFLVTISFLVLIHEGGHFLAAKLARIWVHELAIGFGPPLLRFRIGETRYSLRLFLIGGFVRIAGEEPASRSEEDARVPEARKFYAKPPLTRMGMVLAGPLSNVLAALLIMILVVGLIGVPYLEVYKFVEGSPAAGLLQPGDRLVAVEGRPIYFIEQLQRAVQRQGERGQPVRLTVEREGELLELAIAPRLEGDRYIIGVYFVGSGTTRRVPFPQNVAIGLVWVKNIIFAMYLAFKGIFTGAISPGEALTGPVGIASIVGQSLAMGLLPFFTLVAALSLIIGLINLVPFPALDGSRAAFILYELVRGRPIPPEREGLVHYIGFVILMGLLLLITYNDILRLIRR